MEPSDEHTPRRPGHRGSLSRLPPLAGGDDEPATAAPDDREVRIVLTDQQYQALLEGQNLRIDGPDGLKLTILHEDKIRQFGAPWDDEA